MSNGRQQLHPRVFKAEDDLQGYVCVQWSFYYTHLILSCYSYRHTRIGDIERLEHVWTCKGTSARPAQSRTELTHFASYNFEQRGSMLSVWCWFWWTVGGGRHVPPCHLRLTRLRPAQLFVVTTNNDTIIQQPTEESIPNVKNHHRTNKPVRKQSSLLPGKLRRRTKRSRNAVRSFRRRAQRTLRNGRINLRNGAKSICRYRKSLPLPSVKMCI